VESSTTKIWSLAEPIAQELGLELLEVEFAGGGQRHLVRIYLDSPDPDKSVSLVDCETMSRRLGDVLDAHEPVSGRYMLEVSSPGVNRPLKKREHFERVVGGRVRVRTTNGDGAKRRVLGRLRRMDGVEAEIEVDGGEIGRCALGDLDGASLEF
jgi:ribosome maturation factor RimP